LALAMRRIRRHAGLSQRALAAKAGVSAATVARIETGSVDPTLATLLRLLAAAGVTLTVTGLEPTTFAFGIVEGHRDAAGRRPPPHRLSNAGFGGWDTSLGSALRRARIAHESDLAVLSSAALARRLRRR
jgi:transcriptional regulator with XRE-family HTH domain